MNQPRREARDSLMLLATMRLADQPDPLRIKVRNLSKGGMMAESPVHTVPGERLMIDLRNLGWINGTVAWVAENRFGVIFDREVDCKAVRQPAGGHGDTYVRHPVYGANDPAPAREPGILRRV